jgi:transposase
VSGHPPCCGRVAAQKKSPLAQERDEQKRGLWRWLASRFDARRLIFVDESGFSISMDRLRSRAPRGERVYGRVPRNRGKNQTLIASMSLRGGMGGCMCIEGATDAAVFEAYVEEVLAPSLLEGQVVVLDGLGAHRTAKVRELIEGRGCDLLFLPPYSPDLNPIEEAFSKIKNLVRKAGEREREALNGAIAAALRAIRPRDVIGWFTHCGCYESRDQYS